MGNLFAELNKSAEKQRQDVQELTQSPIEEIKTAQSKSYPIEVAQKSEQKVEQVNEQISRQLSKQVTKSPDEKSRKALSKQITTQSVEDMSYQLRRVLKNKVSAEIPEQWKRKLDGIAVDLNVGRYELVTYIIGLFLGEAGENEKP